MPKIEMRWNEARGACIQFGGHYRISDEKLLEEALNNLVNITRDEDTFDLDVSEIDPETSEKIRTIAKQEHGFPEDLPEELRSLFQN